MKLSTVLGLLWNTSNNCVFSDSGFEPLFPVTRVNYIVSYEETNQLSQVIRILTFRHRASCILGQVFHYSPENAFYIYLIDKYISLSDICLTVRH